MDIENRPVNRLMHVVFFVLTPLWFALFLLYFLVIYGWHYLSGSIRLAWRLAWHLANFWFGDGAAEAME